MALYELSDNQVKNITNWLKNLSIQANYEQRQQFDKKLNSVFERLNHPIQPAGKPKEEKING